MAPIRHHQLGDGLTERLTKDKMHNNQPEILSTQPHCQSPCHANMNFRRRVTTTLPTKRAKAGPPCSSKLSEPTRAASSKVGKTRQAKSRDVREARTIPASSAEAQLAWSNAHLSPADQTTLTLMPSATEIL